MSRRFRHHDWAGKRGGFTLIEILLSLGLAALVMVALATAVDVHLRCLQIGRTNAEEAQLARVLLLRIGDDLRNAAVSNPVDASKIPPAASATDTDEGGTGDPDAPTDTTGDTTDETTTDDLGLAETATEDEYVIGLYGESDWLQVDVRRTPRLDQYDYETLPSGAESLPDVVSGVKTVAYSLSTDTGTASTTGEYRGGLLRREIDHAVTRWAEDVGTLTTADEELEPIAPEVTDLEFLYFDGTEWVDSWDSTEMAGLPMAVHVSLSIMSREDYNRFTRTWGRSATSVEPTTKFVYSLTVALPVAEGDMSESEATTGDTEATTESDTEGGAGL